jgi:hypothetical protein
LGLQSTANVLLCFFTSSLPSSFYTSTNILFLCLILVTDDNSASDPLKSTDWYPAVPDYIDVAFQTARAAGGKNVKVW